MRSVVLLVLSYLLITDRKFQTEKFVACSEFNKSKDFAKDWLNMVRTERVGEGR